MKPLQRSFKKRKYPYQPNDFLSIKEATEHWERYVADYDSGDLELQNWLERNSYRIGRKLKVKSLSTDSVIKINK